MALASDSLPTLDDWMIVDNETTDTAASLDFDGGGVKGNLPLTSRSVEVDLDCNSGLAEVVESFKYLASSDCSATFNFPLPSKSAICRFQAELGEKVIKCKTKRKSEADRDYTEAVSQGHTAVKLSQQSNDRIFQISLGNLAAGEACTIRVEYVQVLDQFSRLLEYTHTASWVPPYIGSVLPETVSEEDRKRQSPTFASKVSYSLTYNVRIRGDEDLAADCITCASHSANIVADAPGKYTLGVSEEVSDPSKDFQLTIAPKNQAGSRIQMQTLADGSEAESTVLATFRVDERLANPMGVSLKQEMVLVIDCSGSMGGEPIQQAFTAACFFIRDLPVEQGACFNVVLFGSRFVKMWDAPKEYSGDTEQEALAWLSQHEAANMGGTEMMAALRDIYSTPPHAGWERQVMLITDGGVSSGENEQLWKLVTNKKAAKWDLVNKRKVPQTHVFTLGIGHGIHRPLLDGVASRSGGAAQYVVNSADIAVKMGWLSKAARSQNRVYNPRLITRGCLLGITPAKLPTILWPDNPLVVLAAVRQTEKGAELEMVCEDGAGKPVSIKLPIPNQATSHGKAFKALHAMSTVSELLGGSSVLHLDSSGHPRQPPPSPETVKDEIVRLACENNLVTPHTSSVGVLLSRDPLDPSTVIHHEIPIQLPHGRTKSQAGTSAAAPFLMQGSMFRSRRQYRQAQPTMSYTMGKQTNWPGGWFGGSKGRAAKSTAPAPAHAIRFGVPSALGSAPPQLPAKGATMASPATSGFLALMDGASYGGEGDDVQSSFLAVDAQLSRGERLESSRHCFSSAEPQIQAHSQAAIPSPVRSLSTLRTTAGFWAASPQLWEVLAERGGGDTNYAAHRLRGSLGVGGLECDDAWATILVLAWLTKHARRELGLWGGMWDKAFAWLQGQAAMKEALAKTPVEQMVYAAKAQV